MAYRDGYEYETSRDFERAWEPTAGPQLLSSRDVAQMKRSQTPFGSGGFDGMTGVDCGHWRKLVDIGPGGERLERAIEGWLDEHAISFRKRAWGECDGITRYLVQSKDLCCAQSVLPAIHTVGGTGMKITETEEWGTFYMKLDNLGRGLEVDMSSAVLMGLYRNALKALQALAKFEVR